MSKNNRYEKVTRVLTSKGSNIGIVYTMKQGSSSLSRVANNYPETFEVIEQNFLNTDFTFIIPLRSPYEKWVSGNLQELTTKLELDSNVYKYHEEVHYESPIESIRKYFENFDFRHIRDHAELGKWVHKGGRPLTFNLVKLYELENVYFINLEDLSKPSLIEWMSKRDKNWSLVKEIYKVNVSNKSNEKIMFADYINQIIDRKSEEDEIFNIFYGKFLDYHNDRKQFHNRKDFQAIEKLLEIFFDLETSVIEMIRKSDKFIKLS